MKPTSIKPVWKPLNFCCASGPLRDDPFSTGTTCLLPLNHSGPCQWTPNSLLDVNIDIIKGKRLERAVTKS